LNICQILLRFTGEVLFSENQRNLRANFLPQSPHITAEDYSYLDLLK
jgi:hypothetical protein